MADCIPYFEPGGKLTAVATANVTAKRFVAISANAQSGPGLVADPLTLGDGSNYKVAHATAGAAAFGVAATDIASGKRGTIHCTPGMIVPVTCAADITAGAEVEVGTSGQAIPKASGVAVGRAMTGATNGGDAAIRIYGH